IRAASSAHTSSFSVNRKSNSGLPASTFAPRAAKPHFFGACSATAPGWEGSGIPARSAPAQRPVSAALLPTEVMAFRAAPGSQVDVEFRRCAPDLNFAAHGNLAQAPLHEQVAALFKSKIAQI